MWVLLEDIFEPFRYKSHDGKRMCIETLRAAIVGYQDKGKVKARKNKNSSGVEEM